MDEKKDLLIREICCKLQYGLMLQTSDENDVTNDCRLVEVFNDGSTCNISMFNGETNCVSGLNGIKPYLRPMRTMTEEELKEYKVLSSKFGMTEFHKASAALDNWLDRKMFDHRGLIPKGLALEAKEGMYIKNEKDMTKKEILIRDLCGRLPYKPMVHIENSATGVSYDQELNPLHITMLTESDVVTTACLRANLYCMVLELLFYCHLPKIQ